MSKEITHVICTRSSRDGVFKKGTKYSLVDNIPITNNFTVSYTWNNHIRTTDPNLAQFEPYVEEETPYEKCLRMFPIGSTVKTPFNHKGIVKSIAMGSGSITRECVYANDGALCLYDHQIGKYATIHKLPAAEYPLTVNQLVPGKWYTTSSWWGIVIRFEKLIASQIRYSASLGRNDKIKIDNRWAHYEPGMMFKEVANPDNIKRSDNVFIGSMIKTEVFGTSDKVQEAIDMIAGLTQN
jgi:hypothetical protein